MPGPGSVACPKPTPRVFFKRKDRLAKEKQAAAFRIAVWKRAGGRCERCDRYVRRTLELLPEQGHVHHKRGRNVAPEDRYNPDRAELLCAICHAEEHS